MRSRTPSNLVISHAGELRSSGTGTTKNLVISSVSLAEPCRYDDCLLILNEKPSPHRDAEEDPESEHRGTVGLLLKATCDTRDVPQLMHNEATDTMQLLGFQVSLVTVVNLTNGACRQHRSDWAHSAIWVFPALAEKYDIKGAMVGEHRNLKVHVP